MIYTDKMITTFDNGHSHTWQKELMFTSFNKGHKHRIDARRKLALPTRPGAHSHRLLLDNKTNLKKLKGGKR